MAKGKVMALREESKQLSKNAKNEMRQLYEKVKQRPLTCLICIIVIVTAAVLLIALPHWQVSGINNVTEKVTQENQSRATLAQILGGTAVGIGIYFAWGNLTTVREGQITERFTRAIEQLGNEKIEIRLGGIYSLERISHESDKDYWPIMEILTAYVRSNSPAKIVETEEDDDSPFSQFFEERKDGSGVMDFQLFEDKKDEAEVNKLPLDIQAILTVIGRRRYSPPSGETEPLDLEKTNLSRFNLIGANLEGADLQEASLRDAKLQYANLQGAYLKEADLQGANLIKTHLNDSILKRAKFQHATLAYAVLTNANLQEANLKHAYLGTADFESADFGHDDDFDPLFWGFAWAPGATLENAYLHEANLKKANLKGTTLKRAVFKEANLEMANLENANLEGADLRGAYNLTIDQLSKVRTLYNSKLDENLEKTLREKYPALFEEPKDKP